MDLFLNLISLLLNIFSLLILVRVFLSWVPNVDRSNPTVDNLIRLVYDITEPVLRPIRAALPATSGVDFSPMVVLIAIWFIRMFLRV